MNIERPKSKQPLPEHAKKVFKGILFDVYQWEQELFDGTTATFEKLKRPDTVVVFPVLEDGRILLAEQEQPGKPPYTSAFGGRVEEGEDPLEAAKRELLEETGYEAGRFFLWGAEQPTSKVDWAVYTFIAKDMRKVAEPNLDGGEKIAQKPLSFEELLEFASDGRFVEREMVVEFIQAKFDPTKREELSRLFDPKT